MSVEDEVGCRQDVHFPRPDLLNPLVENALNAYRGICKAVRQIETLIGSRLAERGQYWKPKGLEERRLEKECEGGIFSPDGRPAFTTGTRF